MRYDFVGSKGSVRRLKNRGIMTIFLSNEGGEVVFPVQARLALDVQRRSIGQSIETIRAPLHWQFEFLLDRLCLDFR